jgi:hypothetical protein
MNVIHPNFTATTERPPAASMDAIALLGGERSGREN